MNKKLIALLLPIMLIGCSPVVSSQNGNGSNGVNSSEIGIKGYNITIKENPNCTITTSKQRAERNEVVEIYITNIKEGYSLSKITINGRKIDKTQFIMPNEDVEIEVFLKNDNNIDGINSIFVTESEYALIWTNKESYDTGETVNIEYKCKGNYTLDFFTVNGEAIEGNSFVMPDIDVTIEGTFKLAFEDTVWRIRSSSGGLTARSFWYFNYGEEGLEITVKVDDRMLCGEEFKEKIYHRDNIEMIITPKSEFRGWEPYITHKFLISCDGEFSIQYAVAGNDWAYTFETVEEDFNFTLTHKSLENNDGYNGYEVKVFLSYGILSLDKEEALGNLTICPAIRNTTSHNVTDWRCIDLDSVVWEDCSTHPILLEDGSYQERG